jgi:hypothetical protein
MPLVNRVHESGLVLAEEAGDEARLSRAIKEIDSRYVLQRHPGEVDGGWVYKVFCIVSEDQPAVCILTWADGYGNPLPLSSGLVEELKKWRPENRRRRGPDADERNQRLREETDRVRQEELAAISQDHRPFVERNRFGIALDARPRKRYWQRGRTPPRSGLS